MTAKLCPKEIYRTAISLLCFGASCLYATDPTYSYLKAVQFDHPFCDGRITLDVARETFVPIANDLPGNLEYNYLIKLYRQEKWAQFDSELATFYKTYESSPLREAASFLHAQSKFDRLSQFLPLESQEIRDAEKFLKQVLLLYPNSTLIPDITASIASFWSRRGAFPKSLALYSMGKEQFPLHTLACVFQMGIGEASYHMREWDAASSAFNLLLQKCQNPRLRAGAETRLADLEALRGGNPAALYEKIFNQATAFVGDYYPFLFHNLGELKYRMGEYAASRFYFKEYLKAERTEPKCLAFAQKRLADVALNLNQKNPVVVGLYLEAHEKAPISDIGRYSYIRGLLMGFHDVAPAELARRIKVIDEHGEKIIDDKIRQFAFLEKGLVLLDRGEAKALDYLTRLNEKKFFNYESGALGDFLRANAFSVAKAHVEKIENRKSFEDSEMFAPLEKLYTEWLEKTSYAEATRKLYSRQVFLLAKDYFAQKEYEGVVSLIKRWKKSKLYNLAEVEKSQRAELSREFLSALTNSTPTESEKAAKELNAEPELIAEVLGGDVQAFQVASAVTNKDLKHLAELLPNAGPQRALASLEFTSPDWGSLWLTYGKAYFLLKRYDDAEKAYKKVKEPELMPIVWNDRLSMFRETKKHALAFQAALSLLSTKEAEERLKLLSVMRDIASDGKLWKEAGLLLKLANDSKVTGKDSAPYLYFAAKADYELAKCNQAIPLFETAIKADPQGLGNGEARYRLGKCLWKTNKQKEARTIWEELSKLEDPFWSPLAKNELNILK